MPNLVTVDSNKSSGGLALFWKRGVDVGVKSLSEYHIDSIIKEDDGLLWRFTGIYGESRNDKKENTWVTMRDLKAKFDLPWLYSGDFNEILFGCEKEGGSQGAKSNM